MLSARFSRSEAAQILGVDAGALPFPGDSITAAQLESFCRDALLRIYRAEATVAQVASEAEEIEIALPEPAATAPNDAALNDEPNEIAPFLMHSIAEFQETEQRARENQRIAPRYIPRRQMGGTFRQSKFTIVQMSASGLRIRHDDTLRAGDEARLTFSIVNPARTFVIRARVVWTSIAQRGDGPSFCISGLRAVHKAGQLAEAIHLLLAMRALEPEKPAEPAAAARPSVIHGLADEDVAAIIRAVRLLSSDPIEANRWYTRARFALADDSIRRAAPTRARDREESLAVWEFLDRRLDIKAVAGVVSWMRQTRAASAV